MMFLSPADLKDGKPKPPGTRGSGCLCLIYVKKRGYPREEPQIRSLPPDYWPGSISRNAV